MTHCSPTKLSAGKYSKRCSHEDGLGEPAAVLPINCSGPLDVLVETRINQLTPHQIQRRFVVKFEVAERVG